MFKQHALHFQNLFKISVSYVKCVNQGLTLALHWPSIHVCILAYVSGLKMLIIYCMCVLSLPGILSLTVRVSEERGGVSVSRGSEPSGPEPRLGQRVLQPGMQRKPLQVNSVFVTMLTVLVPRDVCYSIRGLGERVQAACVVSEQCSMNYLLCNITMQCKKTHTITKLKDQCTQK